MTLLIASDLSVRTDQALRRGMRLGRDLALAVEIVHVIDKDLPAELLEKTRAWAEQSIRRQVGDLAQELGTGTPTVTVLAGNAKRDVARHAYRIGAGLLVLGTHDPHKDGFMGFGHTTAGSIVCNSHLPVLLVSSEANDDYHDVIVGVDFSIYSTAAVKNAIRLFQGARLHLVHAYHVPYKGRLGTADYLAEAEDLSRANLESYIREEIAVLTQRAEATSGQKVDFQVHLSEGTPVNVLRAALEEIKGEPIVIGTHGSSGLAKAIWGSVAQTLLDHPPCDILIVHDH